MIHYRKITQCKLFAPKECWEFQEEHPEWFEEYGCGPGKLGDWLVPDTIWFLSIKPACQIHDWYYREWDGEDRKEADVVFSNNMQRIIKASTKNRWLLERRLKRAELYYQMVRKRGSSSFWENRNSNEEYREVKIN